MTRKTVLHVIHTSGAGGAETVVLQLVRHLDPDSWRSIVVVPAEGWLSDALRDTGADVVVLPNRGSFDLRLVHGIVQLARTRWVALIHSHLFGPAVYGTLAARLLGLPLVATIHGRVDLAQAHRWWGLKKRLLRRQDSQFVGVTESLRHELVHSLGLDVQRCRAIANGIDTRAYSPKPADGRLRSDFGWTKEHVVIGALGNVRSPKGYEFLLRAARLLRDDCPAFRFVIIGDTGGQPGLYQDLLAMRADWGLTDRVAFAGFRDDVCATLNDLDIYVLSSVEEGLPLAVLQAMAVRLPIVATRCGGPQEVLVDGESALLVEPRDAAALARQIRHLAEHAGERDRLAEGARRAVLHGYTIERMIRSYEALYAESMGATPRPRSERLSA